MIAIGIDPSLTGTAVCVLRDGNREPLDMHRFSSAAADGVYGRINRYSGLSASVLDAVSGMSPEATVFIEGYSFASPGNSARWLAEYGGVLRYGLIGAGFKVIEVPPQSLKKFATGKGGAKKEMVMAHVAQRWNRIFDTSDEADAFCLAQLGLRYLGMVECETTAMREVIARLKTPPLKVSRKRKAIEA